VCVWCVCVWCVCVCDVCLWCVCVCLCVCVCCCLVQHEPLEIFTETNSVCPLLWPADQSGTFCLLPYCSALLCPFTLLTSLAMLCDVTVIPADQIFTQNIVSSQFSVSVSVLRSGVSAGVRHCGQTAPSCRPVLTTP
jgi:hypothetical protein